MKKFFSFFTMLIFWHISFPSTIHILNKVYKPEAIFAGEKYLYITEGYEIKIFSRKNLKYVKSFGKKGEGPGEFKGFILAYPAFDYIFVNCPGKVLYFNSEGEFLKERRSVKIWGRFKPIKKQFTGYVYNRKNGQRYEHVYLYDSNLKPLKQLYSRPYFRQDNGKINLIIERPPFFYISQDRIYIDGIDGNINVFNSDGEKIRVIAFPVEKIPFTHNHKEAIENQLQKNQRTRKYFLTNRKNFIYPEYLPPVRMYHLVNNYIYILTSKAKNGKLKMIVLNLGGKVLGEKFVNINHLNLFPRLYCVYDGKIYGMVENQEKECWEMEVMEVINPNLLK